MYPAIFRKMLAYDYPWDTVQMPVNVLDAHFRSFQKNILPILLENAKPVARDGHFEPFRTTTQFDGAIGRQLHGLA